MKHKKEIQKISIFLIIALGATCLSVAIYKHQNNSNLSIPLDEIRQIIDKHNENIETYEQIRCEETLEIAQILNADIDSDRKKEVIVNLICNELDLTIGSHMYLLVLEKSQTQWTLKFVHPYSAFHSKATLEDLDEDGKNEIFIQSYSGLGGGSAGYS
ncbi:MAG: hypothetical protein HN391_13440, partial [Anaerolineae bacterium]|nr:hypothetical protein [Anaerolineae bacterium]